MQLLECIANKPGLLDNKKLEFNGGITIIYGQNESGKTLIAKAIADTLWGEFSGNFALNSNAWDDLYLEVIFTNFSNKYRFIKNKKESFLINYTNIEDGNNAREKVIIMDNPWRSGGQIVDSTMFIKLFNETNDSETTRLFNKVNLDTFLDLSFVPEPAEIMKNGLLRYNALQKFLVHDNSNFYSLHEDITDLYSNNKVDGNYNNSILNEIIKAEGELRNINKRLDIFNIDTNKSQRIIKEKKRLELELSTQTDTLKDIRKQKLKLLDIQKNFKLLNEIKNRIENKNKEKEKEQERYNIYLEKEEELKNQYPQFFNFKESNIRNLKKIQETYREVRDVYEEIGNFHSASKEKKNKFKNIILGINFFSIIIMAFLFSINYIFPIPVLNEYKILFILGLLTLSISSSLLFLLYSILNLKSGELKEIMKKKYNVEKKLEATLKKNSITFNEYKLEAIYEYLVKYFEEYGEYSINRSELLDMKESFKGANYIRSIDIELEELKAKGNSIKLEIDRDFETFMSDNMIKYDLDIINRLIYTKNLEIKDLKTGIRQNNEILSLIEKETNMNDETEDVKFLVEEKNNLNLTLERLNFIKTSISFIDDIIKEAILKREDKQISRLVKKTCEIFHYLTDSQYIDTLNENTLRQILKENLHKEDLHTSVMHMLLLSIKFAITDSFNDLEINLPLIIDEPFQQMDDQRTVRFRQILEDISSKRQVIIFTHNSKYKDWGTFIEL